MIIAIYGSRRQYGAFKYVEAFLDILRQRGDKIVMHRKLYMHLFDEIPAALTGIEAVNESPTPAADLAVSLGGDGTFLRTALWLNGAHTPIVGVNTGHLGYLTALTVDKLHGLPEMIASDRLRIESRTILQVLSPELPREVGQYALNEVAVLKEESASMIEVAVSLGSMPLAEYRADGLVTCTSTGSTAYNLSVGGPIVEPTLDVCVLSPIAAHTLSMRPLVVSPDAPITIVPSGRARHIRIALDGRSVQLDNGTPIVVGRAPFKILVMQLADHTFADTLRQKLHWGEA